MSKRLVRSRAMLAAALLVSLLWLGCTGDTDVTAPAIPAPNISQVDASVLAPAIAAQERHTDGLMVTRGVVGTAVGLTADGQPVIKIFTREAGVAGLPESLEGVPVAVEVTGMIVALSALTDPTARQPRPVPIGVSTGHPDMTAGTIGARVKNTAGDVFALSNNHIYANQNDADLGESALQPGPFDGGEDPADKIGELFAFEPIDFDGADNTIDAAIALSSTAMLSNATPSDDGYGTPNSAILGDGDGDGFIDNTTNLLNLNVQKYGRTTGLTTGTISSINATVDVCYECGGGPFCRKCEKLARFVDQIIITPGTFSDPGDSGSLCVANNADAKPFGLLFAGSSTITIANRIDLVLANFGVTIDGATAPVTEVTDVAVTDVTAPASVVQGDVVSVDVTVENAGNQDVASFDVTLKDLTANVVIGTQTVTSLAAGSPPATLTYSWNTAGASLVSHTLEGSHTLADQNNTNDAATTTVTVEAAVTDVAVTGVSAPASVVQGDVEVSVDVTVQNVGNQNVGAFDVTLTDVTDGPIIGTQPVASLAAGASTTLTYSWNVPAAASLGSHTLRGSHNLLDDNNLNDAATTAVTVNEPTVGTAPVVDLCDPGTGNREERLLVVVSGSNFLDEATVDFGEGIKVQKVAFVSSSQLDVKIRIHRAAAFGFRNVIVTNPDGQFGTKAACFTVN